MMLSGTARARGFTLLEILVSMAILVVVTVILTKILGDASSAWLSSEDRQTRNRSARALADMIGQELRGATLPVEGVAPASTPNLQMLINPPHAMVPAEYQSPHAIFWQAPLATEQSLGELAEIGYFVKWEDLDGGMVPSLRRFFVNPTVTDPDTGKVKANDDFLIYTDAQNWLSKSLIDRVAPATESSGYAGLVAEYVVGLWVRFYGADGKEIGVSPQTAAPAASFDSREGYTYEESLLGGEGVLISKTVRRYLPARVVVSIAQFDRRHGERIGTQWERVKELVNDSKHRDAAAFARQFTEEAQNDASLRGLLPGLRTYETSVVLQNAR